MSLASGTVTHSGYGPEPYRTHRPDLATLQNS